MDYNLKDMTKIILLEYCSNVINKRLCKPMLVRLVLKHRRQRRPVGYEGFTFTDRLTYRENLHQFFTHQYNKGSMTEE